MINIVNECSVFSLLLGKFVWQLYACNDVSYSYKSASLAATMAETSDEGAVEQALPQVDVPRPSLHLDNAVLERRDVSEIAKTEGGLHPTYVPPRTKRTSSRIRPFGRIVAKSRVLACSAARPCESQQGSV